MNDDDILIYPGILIGIWAFNIFKTIIIQIITGAENNEFFCPEFIIAIIITQFFIVGSTSDDKFGTYLKYSFVNIILTSIAWGFGTSSGGRSLFGHPSHMLIKILLGFIC